MKKKKEEKILEWRPEKKRTLLVDFMIFLSKGGLLF